LSTEKNTDADRTIGRAAMNDTGGKEQSTSKVGMDEKTLRALHRDCALKLERFIQEAGKMCDLLAKMEEFPLSRAVRSATALAGRKEEVALAAYQEARRKFFESAISPATDLK